MPPQTYSLKFHGYWREPNIEGIPGDAGVYCVYACTHTQEKKISIRTLIYIGEAEDAHDRIEYHEKWGNWRKHLRQNEEICFNFAPTQPTDRARVEAALIFHHKPPENSEYKDTFPFDKTTIDTGTEKNKCLDTRFTVLRSETD
jgi:hypothetical protein